MLSLPEWLAKQLATVDRSCRSWQDSAHHLLGNFFRVLRKAYTKAQASSGLEPGTGHNHVHGLHCPVLPGLQQVHQYRVCDIRVQYTPYRYGINAPTRGLCHCCTLCAQRQADEMAMRMMWDNSSHDQRYPLSTVIDFGEMAGTTADMAFRTALISGVEKLLDYCCNGGSRRSVRGGRGGGVAGQISPCCSYSQCEPHSNPSSLLIPSSRPPPPSQTPYASALLSFACVARFLQPGGVSFRKVNLNQAQLVRVVGGTRPGGAPCSQVSLK